MSANIYVIKHKPYLNLETEIFKSISPNYYGENNIIANTGKNISNENRLYAEYSTFYWVWKNNNISDIVGFFHYRRYLSFNNNVNVCDSVEDLVEECKWSKSGVEEVFLSCDIIVPPPIDFPGTTVYDYYCGCHDPFYMNKALEIIQSKYPEHINSINTALKRSYGYYCNLFVTRKEIFNGYMEFIFDVFNELKVYLKPNYQPKIFAYLAERLFSGYVEYLSSVKKYRVREMPIIFIKEVGNRQYSPHIGWIL